LTETFGKFHKLLFEGSVFVTAQAVFEQTRDDLTYADIDTAEQRRQLAVILAHYSAIQTRTSVFSRPVIMQVRKK
jgi:hypothetical protein